MISSDNSANFTESEVLRKILQIERKTIAYETMAWGESSYKMRHYLLVEILGR